MPKHSAFLPAALALLLLPTASLSVGSVSTVAPRPMAMGGAFVAVEDELAAIPYNPAALLLPRCGRGCEVRVHLNILGAPAIIRETGLLTGVETEQYSGLSGPERFGIAVGSALKGVALRVGGISFGMLLLEEQLDPDGLAESRGLADAGSLLDAYYTSFVAVFRLGPTVAIGIGETIYAGVDESGERTSGTGRSYGVVLKPNDRVTVGLAYFTAPSSFAQYRRALEGFAPRTVNAGLALRCSPALLLTFDLRDLSEKHPDTGLEPRIGIERSFWGKFALRAGCFREGGEDPAVLTLGLGAIPMPGCWSASEGRRPDSFVLNYSVLASGETLSHLLSAVLHF